MTPGELLAAVAVAAAVIVAHGLWHARRTETTQERSARVLREINEEQ